MCMAYYVARPSRHVNTDLLKGSILLEHKA